MKALAFFSLLSEGIEGIGNQAPLNNCLMCVGIFCVLVCTFIGDRLQY